jgi:hypothetical protein
MNPLVLSGIRVHRRHHSHPESETMGARNQTAPGGALTPRTGDLADEWSVD